MISNRSERPDKSPEAMHRLLAVIAQDYMAARGLPEDAIEWPDGEEHPQSFAILDDENDILAIVTIAPW